jgi:hypothetical protein
VTLNVTWLTAPAAIATQDASQAYSTTLQYISLTNRMQEAAADVFVPDILRRAKS